MKLYVCPICATRFAGFEIEALSRYDYIYCTECGYPVLPLSTPQEVTR